MRTTISIVNAETQFASIFYINSSFTVDWNLTPPLESASINKAHSIGLAVADFIATIFNKTGETYLDIHLVGISLGCEVAASAARHVSELSGRKINRITGLDPTYYLINDGGDLRKLSAKNADFVDVVHTNLSKRTGELEQIGHVDFYVDDLGDNCNTKGKYSIKCDPLKSITLFAKSVNSNDIKAKKCDSLEDFREGVCENKEQVTFGEMVDKNVRGKYFLKY
ncbi:hypothetical protein NQ314_019900 [Rhamnusium bicolor]|uniref:Lipase domain-containing protein n=1 Tax=Rhamnusium bicolor TaxID=1586634 RepID=A0AAV8WMX2_9CUCU|nr:hypothetical protein NQ314_019900 [Rhamnusium bicolor]